MICLYEIIHIILRIIQIFSCIVKMINKLEEFN